MRNVLGALPVCIAFNRCSWNVNEEKDTNMKLRCSKGSRMQQTTVPSKGAVGQLQNEMLQSCDLMKQMG